MSLQLILKNKLIGDLQIKSLMVTIKVMLFGVPFKMYVSFIFQLNIEPEGLLLSK
jgi:hypothetical protein